MADEKEPNHQGTAQAESPPKIARDTEWYKKRREDVPAINRGNPSENPFKLLFQSGKPEQTSGNSKNDAESNQAENGD